MFQGRTLEENSLNFSTTGQPSQKIPFVKGIQIGIREQTDQPEQADPTENLQLDFWTPKKKGEAHKVHKNGLYQPLGNQVLPICCNYKIGICCNRFAC